MKKIALLAVAVLLLFVTACGGNGKQMLDRLTKEDILSDFDYMMQLMEDTFPHFDVAKRRFGVDIRALAQRTRDKIENYPYFMQSLAAELGIDLNDLPELDKHIFWSIVHHEFLGPLFPLGHITMLDSTVYSLLFPRFSRYFPKEHYPASYFNYQVFRNPTTQNFYEEHKSLFLTLATEDPALFSFIFRTRIAIPSQSRITTNIIEEGRIAYIYVPSFMGGFFAPGAQLNAFYDRIQNYEHLIIDIRDNIGGGVDFWRMLIMYPLWSDRDNMPNMPLYAFYRDNELGRLWGEAHVKEEISLSSSRYVPETDYLLTVTEIFATSYLPYFNENDFQRFSYGIRLNTSLSNIEQSHFANFGITGRRIPFKGQIWLLINEHNLSAAALFARHAKHMNFATLVGESTGGAYTWIMPMHFALPNTGIIVGWDVDYLVDQYGRSLEEFPTTPHYFNRPGLDALETVLQLIEEGSY